MPFDAAELAPDPHPSRSRAAALARYMWDKGGPGAYHGVEALAFVKSQPDLIAPDIQYHFEMIMYRENGRVVIPEHGFTPLFNISRPKSRGWLKIQSADPTSTRAFSQTISRIRMTSVCIARGFA